jgi:hypothetical protein
MRNPDPGRQKTLTEKERDEESCCFERLEVFFVRAGQGFSYSLDVFTEAKV